MSLSEFSTDLLEIVALTTHAPQKFVSSSLGVTGSVPLLAKSSDSIKSIEVLSRSLGDYIDESPGNLDPMQRASATVREGIRAGKLSSNVFDDVNFYMDSIPSVPEDSLNDTEFHIKALSPSPKFTKVSNLKNYIQNNLMHCYRESYSNCNTAYTNYHTLNFFTSSHVPSDTVFLYPNFTASRDSSGKPYISAPYIPKSQFSIDFYINPRYQNDVDIVNNIPTGKDFKAGTIFHLSSTFALSLVTGSSTDSYNKSDKFRLLLQLSHSADIAPSKIDLSVGNNERTYPNDLIFVTGDNTLRKNRWHHVSIRWGGDRINQGTGSIHIDDYETRFVVPSASIAHQIGSSVTNEPDALCVGNYYEGNNQGSSALSAFFNSTAAAKHGIPVAPGHSSDPDTYSFNHPLNAEVHELKIYNKYIDDSVIFSSSFTGPSDFSDLLFYVPPFFVKETPERDVFVTTNRIVHTSTATPFNTFCAFTTFGHIINLENFNKDFISGRHPRMLNLNVESNASATGSTMNEIIYATASNRKRNLTVLPNDNGLFFPNFEILRSGSESYLGTSSPMNYYVTDDGGFDASIISLKEVIKGGFLRTKAAGDFLERCSGPYPENIKKEWNKTYLAILQRLRDTSSNQITIFNIPSMFYSENIKHGSVRFKDNILSGSGGKISINLRDDTNGGLYRADCLTPQAYWNNVGNIFYNEGLAIIKSPHLMFFGKDQFEAKLEGTHNVYVSTLNCFADAARVNSSSNDGYTPLSASFQRNDIDSKFVYIDQVNIHDDNLNVIMKGSLAQPVVKRSFDKLLFKLKMDF
ncbi:MAG: hypothetical protein CML56_06885 [Rhodobacteraceae bacterium]|nr:hypothetical protein [Paracoccaceae bacterium]